MSFPRKRAWRRWLTLSAGLVVLAGLMLWWVSGSVLAFALERQLRDAGWPDARVDGGALAFPDVVFERVRLTSGETLVAEDVRARLGRGVERITIGQLYIEAGISADGEWVLPGGSASDNDPLPLDLLPPDGIAVDRANIHLTVPAGAVALSGGVSAELDADGAARVRFRIEDGSVSAAAFRAAGFSGEATATLPARGSPALELTADAETAQVADVGLGSLAVEAGWHDGRARLTVATPVPNLAEISLEGEVVLGGASRTASLSGSVVLTNPRAQGQVTFEAELEDAAADTTPAAAADADASAKTLFDGRLRVTGRNLLYSGVFANGALDLSAEIEGDVNGLRVTMSEARAEIVPRAGVVPGAGQAFENDALSLELTADGDRPPSVRWAFADRSVELMARLEARALDARAATALQAKVTPSRDAADDGIVVVDDASAGAAGNAGPRARSAGDFDLDAQVSDLTVRNLPWGDVVLGVDAFDAEIERNAERWRIDGEGTVLATGSVGSVRVESSTADWSGTLTGTSERVVLTADDCIRWRVDEIDVAGTRVTDLSPLCVAPGGDGVLLIRDLGEDRSEFSFAIAEQPLNLHLATGAASHAIEGTWPSLAVTGTNNGADIAILTADVSGGALTLPEAQLALTGLDGSAELRNGRLGSMALRVSRIESLLTPAPIAPVGLEVSAERDGDALSFEAVLSDDLGTFVLEAVGRQAAGRASAEVHLYPVRFISGATQIEDLSPLLAEHVADASGVLEAEGDVEWTGSELTGSGTLKLQDVGAIVAGIPFVGLTTETHFTSVVPPATAPEQTASIAQVNLGMPLEDGIAVFDIDSGGELTFQRIEFEFAGGRLFAEPFTVDSAAAGDTRFVLRAEDVELSHFLTSSQIDGLAGTGVLSGRVPVRLADGGLRLDEGILEAETDGVLRYTPDNLPDFLRGEDVRSRMLREVLTNFHYEELSLAVSGASSDGGEQTLTLNARGANPDFLDGHPIELSFNFRGPLLGAVRSAVDLTDAAELERIFEQQETENEENSR